ncbi:peptide chain release factor N(5)-glutamine methyltransferase [Pseudomonas sp. R2.Fl]|nr:peptide chain release factor N(5)-glutamine methyltransferase [Pseudomonas sp. R2.Fl]
MSGAGSSVGELVTLARRSFHEAGLADAALEARLLVGGLLGLSITQMITGEDRIVAEGDASRVRDAIARRLRHEPVFRILGRRPFHGLDLKVSPATLDPRPDTEILVERVLVHLERIVAVKGSARLLDLGTGTGAIGLALAKACPQVMAVLTDISGEALSIAEENAYMNHIGDQITLIRSDWYAKVSGTFDIIVSNPPYIVREVIASLDPEVRDFDPVAALDGGADGLDAYRAIAAGAPDHLNEGGLVALEIGYDQRDSVSGLFEAHGFRRIEAGRDLAGNDRVLIFAMGTEG